MLKAISIGELKEDDTLDVRREADLLSKVSFIAQLLDFVLIIKLISAV